MDSACALVTFGQGIAPVSRVLGVSRAQLTLRMKASDNKPDKRRQRRDEAADAEVLSRILDIIGDMPAYGYRRVWAILRRQSRNEGLPFVNAKRVYRIMSENSLLLLHDKPSRLQREHKGRISVKESGFAPIFPDTCYHLTHYWLAAADIPVASDNPVHYADAIRYNARTPLEGSLLPFTRLVWA